MSTPSALAFSGYEDLSVLYDSAKTLVYRGVRAEDGLAVILKMLRRDYPTPAELSCYRQEYDILQGLNLEHVVSVYGLERYQNTVFLVLEDFGGVSLQTMLPELRSRTAAERIQQVLEIAIAVTDGLQSLYSANVIHQDINPANLVFNAQSKQLKIIDFGISSALPEAAVQLNRPEKLQGTLAYLSPEQTGRMNRPVDYRADFYSLGATLYTLLIGQPPFTGDDALALVHAHLAQSVVAPHVLDASIPPELSAVVVKLLAKNAEDRYQSAQGLKADLLHCLDGCIQGDATTGEATPTFVLGQQDQSDRLQISKQLYGREQELALLKEAFEQLMQPTVRPQVLMVSGPAGTGKTVLLKELYKPLSAYDGYFISGKFDQLQRGTPYFGIFQAFQSLIEQLLTLSADDLAVWRSQLESALADNLAVMVEALPDLAVIVGERPAPPALAPDELSNRFRRSVIQFVQAFTRSGQPLVMLLDDLHWADEESLSLLRLLLRSRSADRLMLVGSYRDEDISATHPLTRLLRDLQAEELEENAVHLTLLSLTALPLAAVQALLQDTLRRTAAPAAELAQTVWEKTGGNPFFVGEFLRVLRDKALLWFDVEAQAWNWDIGQIQQREITLNLVDLFTARLRYLPMPVQCDLQLAACLGNRFTLKRLAAISPNPNSSNLNSSKPNSSNPNSSNPSSSAEATHLLNVAQRLHEAIVAGILLPLSADYRGRPSEQTLLPNLSYRFVHDRIQQAAYALLPSVAQSQTHWRIGQQLLHRQEDLHLQAEHSASETVFELANHLNLGREFADRHGLSDLDKKHLIQINVKAGQQAKQSAAFATALTHLEIAVSLLAADDWIANKSESYLETTEADSLKICPLEIYRAAAEAAYASSRYDYLNELAAEIFDQTDEVLDVIWLYELLLNARLGQDQLSEAVSLGLSVLLQLDVVLPAQPSPDDIGAAVASVQGLMAEREPLALMALPDMENRAAIAAMQILTKLFPPAYFFNPMLMPLITLKQVELSLIYGNGPLSPTGYTQYGLLLCSQFNQIEAGYGFSELAFALLDKQQATKSTRAVVAMAAIGFVTHFKKPIKKTLSQLLHAYQVSLDTGDLATAAHSASMYALHAYYIGTPLDKLAEELASYSQSLKQLKQAADLSFVQIYRQGILNLMGRSLHPTQLIGEAYDETQQLSQHERTGNRSSMFLAYQEKSLLCYLFQSYDDALTYTELSKTYLDAVSASVNVSLFYIYDSLIRLAVCLHNNRATDAVPETETAESLQTATQTSLDLVAQNQKTLGALAQHAPENYLASFTLVEAERQRVLGNVVDAMDSYEQAISLATQNGATQEEALANELAGQFHLSQNRVSVADTYLLNARHAYQQWGAIAKVEDLDNQYPHLRTRLSAARSGTHETTTNKTAHSLDLETLLKSAQAIAAEIVSDRLIVTLMRIVLENAGAQRAVLVLPRDGDWWIEAIGDTEGFVAQATPLEADASSDRPSVPLTVINYVKHKQLSVVLECAATAEQFGQDPYLQKHQTQSLLCLPLLNQGQLNGILYLENNLAQGVFDSGRVEALKILLAQAAISIQNAQLYQQLEAYSKTLEQRVSARTQELSQTLEVLKATQAELVVENALLRSDADAATYAYQIGGSLPMDAPTYAVRRADRQLYKALRQGQYCYVLNARQMGKSSLRVQMMQRLTADGAVCAVVDLSSIGNHQMTIEQWYAGFTYALANSLKLLPYINKREIKQQKAADKTAEKMTFRQWWTDHTFLSPVQRLGQFVESVVLSQLSEDIVLFIDEIDSTMSLSFDTDDFFLWLRACFNQRADTSIYQRLSVVLLGVATPSQLVDSTQHTPFNIGQAIGLSGFSLHEAQPLLYGLGDRAHNPQAVLAQVLDWTGGQPFLSQKVCQLVCQLDSPIEEGREAQVVDELVRSHILSHWELKDDPVHLRAVRDRICSQDALTPLMLKLYEQIIKGDMVAYEPTPVQRELLLSGLVVQQEGQLCVANRIYKTIFGQQWIASTLAAHSYTYNPPHN